jgi:CRISPR system Cascade subunit CasD
MAGFLVFTLAAPLMAFGDVAPGERRVGVDRPTRSGLIGLIAAALGLTRDDDRQSALAAQLSFAVRVDAAGRASVDYHTTQTAPAKRNRRFATRREELAVDDVVTILSQRTYVEDGAFTVAVLVEEDGPFLIHEIAAALAHPLLPIHAGRRSCPLGLPPSALVIEAPSLIEAFAAYDAEQSDSVDRAALRKRFIANAATDPLCAVDPRFEARDLLAGFSAHHRETRRDDPVSRTRWQFSPREQIVGRLIAVPKSSP